MLISGQPYTIQGMGGTGPNIAADSNDMVEVSSSVTSGTSMLFVAQGSADNADAFALYSTAQKRYLTCVEDALLAETLSNTPYYFKVDQMAGEADVYSLMRTINMTRDVYMTMETESPGAAISFAPKGGSQPTPKQKWKFIKSVKTMASTKYKSRPSTQSLGKKMKET